MDVVVAGHSHSRLHMRVPNADGSGDKLIVEALSYGVAYDLVDIVVDTRTGDVVAKSAEIPDTGHEGVEPDAAWPRSSTRYRARVAPLADHVRRRDPGTAHARRRELARLVANAERAFAGPTWGW